jgi:hypothetical protein
MNQEANEQLVVYKNNLTTNIKRWVQLDTQLKMINDKTKLMREERSALSSDIYNSMDKIGIVNNKILIPDGYIKIYEKKEYSPLTFGFLEQYLGNIINDQEQVKYIIEYLKQNRDIRLSHDLKRNYAR